MFDRYFGAATKTLGEVAATQGEPLEAAARLVAGSIAAGGVLHLFGSGHSQLLALDAYARAGGLACVNPILDPAISPQRGLEIARAERAPGHGAAIVAGEDLRPGEVVLVASNSNAELVAPYLCRTRSPR